VLKLLPKPQAYATAMVALPSLTDALRLLHRLQDATGGGVEAFEYMPRSYMAKHRQMFPDMPPPFAQDHDVNIMIEVAATTPRDAQPGPDGQLPVVTLVEDMLGQMLDDGTLIDAVIAQNETQRRAIWKRREDAGDVAFFGGHFVNTDIALPLDKVAAFETALTPRLRAIDPDVEEVMVAHLGDGNIHHTSYVSRNDPDVMAALVEAVEDVVQELGGSFSAEHGIGVSKLETMKRRKDPVALDAMRAIKAALDPHNILNPGKVIPHGLNPAPTRTQSLHDVSRGVATVQPPQIPSHYMWSEKTPAPPVQELDRHLPAHVRAIGNRADHIISQNLRSVGTQDFAAQAQVAAIKVGQPANRRLT